jgi:murein DD-endopeptidase MepM/ murein hydrolase activator NlpD
MINLQSKLQSWVLSLKEKLLFYKNDLINYLQKKSVERLTIMFIPHGNEKIYSFHLSFLMILFLVVLFSSLLAVSLSGYFKYKEISSKIEELKKLYGKNYQNTYIVQTKLMDIQKEIKNQSNKNLKVFYKTIFNLNQLPIDYDQSFEISSSILEAELKNNKEIAPNSKYLKATYISSGIKQYLSSHHKIIFQNKENIINKYKLIYELPNGRPVAYSRFRDTSGYGLRLDPVSKSFFEFHSGTDMAGAYKEPIYSTADGVVQKIFYDEGYGNAIMIKHSYGYYTLYAHLAFPAVRVQQKIKKGDLVGFMGATGRVTGVHLHYEVLLNEQIRVNPLPFICTTDIVTSRCKYFNQGYSEKEIEEN